MRLLAAIPLLLLTAPAMAEDKQLKLKVGDEVPDVALPVHGHTEKELSLRGLKGKNVVLFFYPKAMTRGCTVESCGFRDLTSKFAAADTVIVGISTDKLDAQRQFTEKEKLNFPLLADSEQKLARALGVMRDKSVTKRVTFVIDKQGKIAKIYEKVDPKTHPEEVLQFVKENLNK